MGQRVQVNRGRHEQIARFTPDAKCPLTQVALSPRPKRPSVQTIVHGIASLGTSHSMAGKRHYSSDGVVVCNARMPCQLQVGVNLLSGFGLGSGRNGGCQQWRQATRLQWLQ
jgi:hypothetical protein